MNRAGIMLALVLAGLGLQTLPAQPLMEAGDNVGIGRNGFHIYGVNGSLGYSSLATGSSFGTPSAGLGSEWYTFVSTPVGYSFGSPKTTFAVTYTPSYVGRIRYSNQSFNQSLSLQVTQHLGRDSSWFISGFADDSTFEQYLFQTPDLANFVNGPGSSENLNNAVNGGHASTLITPTTAFFGTRVRSFSGDTGMALRFSQRLQLSFDVGVSQYMTKASDVTVNPTLIPKAQTGHANLNLGYSLTPRTQVGMHVTASESRSVFGRNRYGDIGAYASRKLTEHWFASVMAGLGTTMYRTTADTPSSYTYVGDVSLAYKTRGQTFAGSYSRQTGNAYGFNSRAMHSFTGAWSIWDRSRTWEWRVFGSYGLLAGGTFEDTRVFQAGSGVLHGMGHHLNVSLDYVYLNWTIPAIGTVPNQMAHSARLTFNWIPLLRDVPVLNTVTN